MRILTGYILYVLGALLMLLALIGVWRGWLDGKQYFTFEGVLWIIVAMLFSVALAFTANRLLFY